MAAGRVSAAVSRAVGVVLHQMRCWPRAALQPVSLETLEERKLFATYVVSIDPYLTQGNAGNTNTGTLTLKADTRIVNPAGATEDDRITNAIHAAIDSGSATTNPPGTSYTYPNAARFKIAKFSGIAGLTIPSGYTSDD